MFKRLIAHLAGTTDLQIAAKNLLAICEKQEQQIKELIDQGNSLRSDFDDAVEGTAEVREMLDDIDNRINTAIDAVCVEDKVDNAVEEALDNHDLESAIDDAIGDADIESKVEEAVNEVDFADLAEDAVNNLDIRISVH